MYGVSMVSTLSLIGYNDTNTVCDDGGGQEPDVIGGNEEDIDDMYQCLCNVVLGDGPYFPRF